jgi:hypothetical protein
LRSEGVNNRPSMSWPAVALFVESVLISFNSAKEYDKLACDV